MEIKNHRCLIGYCLSFISFCFFLILLAFSSGFSQDRVNDLRDENEFKEKVTFYLDQKVQAVLHQMIQNEKLLLEMVRNVTLELEQRGSKTIRQKDVPFAELYDWPDRLIAEYNKEIDKLTAIVEEAGRLQVLVVQKGKLHLLQPLDNLQVKLTATLNDGRFTKGGLYSSNELLALINDYNREVDALLGFYDQLDLMAETVRIDTVEVREMLADQKSGISRVFDEYAAAPLDTIGQAYAVEVERIESLLQEILKLKEIAHDSNVRVEVALNQLSMELLASLDDRVAAMIQVDHLVPFRYPFALKMFNEWQAKEFVEFRVAFTRHRIIKEALLASASAVEKGRMLEKDLEDALASFMIEDFALSERRFTWVLQDYHADFELAGSRFYRGECYFALNRYEAAQADYESAVENANETDYRAESLFRLMQIADKHHDYAAVARRYKQVESISEFQNQRLLNKCRFLAAYNFLESRSFVAAERALSTISTHSPYYIKGQYLLAIALSGQADYESAISILQFLAQKTNQLARNDLRKGLVDESLLKLGYIHYQLQDYRRSLTYFKLATDPSARNRGRLGVAWAYFKLGNYGKTIANAHALLDQAVTSELCYEALVLVAQAWRELDNDDIAIDALNYVADAQQVFDNSAKFNVERLAIARQINAFVHLEQLALERNDIDAYVDVTENRERLETVLKQFRYYGRTGSTLLDDFAFERESVLGIISELDAMIAEANKDNLHNVMKQADEQRIRLLAVLDRYQADLGIQSKHFFTDYPNSVKEVVEQYRSELLSQVLGEVELERRRLLQDIEQVNKLRSSPLFTGKGRIVSSLEMLAEDFSRLERDSDIFTTWLLNNRVEPSETNFSQWANISAVGISDITMKRIKETDEFIAALAYNNNFVTKTIGSRIDFLAQRVQAYDELIRQLEYELHARRFDEYTEEKESYFRENYFDMQEHEQEAVEE